MDQNFVEKLLKLNFVKVKRIDNIYYFDNEDKLYTTLSRWITFVYFENDKYYISNNGDLVENFDAPNIDIDYMLETIKKEIGKFGCFLNVSRIVKETTLETFEEDLENFNKAIKIVDNLYREL